MSLSSVGQLNPYLNPASPTPYTNGSCVHLVPNREMISGFPHWSRVTWRIFTIWLTTCPVFSDILPFLHLYKLSLQTQRLAKEGSSFSVQKPVPTPFCHKRQRQSHGEQLAYTSKLQSKVGTPGAPHITSQSRAERNGHTQAAQFPAASTWPAVFTVAHSGAKPIKWCFL
jgi:hypothetical protein